MTPQITPAHGSDDIYTDAVDRFVSAAREFCEMIDRRRDLRNRDLRIATRPTDFLRTIQPSLVALYAAGLELPDVYCDDGDNLVVDIPEVESRILFEALVAVLGEYRYYSSSRGFPLADDESFRGNETLVTGDLADDIADVYLDVRAGLSTWESGDPKGRREAVWHWKLLFEAHFGQHLVDAIAAIHRARATP